MSRFAITGACALALAAAGFAAGPASAAHHEAVIQVVTVDVHAGKLEKYRSEVKKLMGVQKRLGTTGKTRMWQLVVGGPDTGAVIVGIEYPNAGQWAAETAKLQADSEWQKIVSGLDKIRSVESNSVWRDISLTPAAASPGGVLAITGVQVKPGKLDTYRKRVDDARKISERLGLDGELRMWHAEVAGPNTGGVAVGVQHESLAAYTADQAKLAGDAEWRRLLASLNELRTLNGRWLYQEITP